MKGFEQILEESSISNILKLKVTYKDFIPSQSYEIPDNIFKKKLVLKYYEGSITEEENNRNNTYLQQEKEIYDLIFKIGQKQYLDVIKQIEQKNNIDDDIAECLWLYFSIDKEYSEIKEGFEKLLVLYYSITGCRSIKNIAFEAFNAYKNDRALLQNVDNAKFLICDKSQEDYNKSFGQLEEDPMCNESEIRINDEDLQSKSAGEDWISKKFGGVNNG